MVYLSMRNAYSETILTFQKATSSWKSIGQPIRENLGRRFGENRQYSLSRRKEIETWEAGTRASRFASGFAGRRR
jgi:hypothetical protein